MPRIPDRFGGWFWSVPAFLEYVQEPLTDPMVAAAEAQLGVQLPAVYLQMLRQQNGGYLRAGWPDTTQRTLYGIGEKFPSITLDGAWWRPNNADEDTWVPDASHLLIPFDGDGHWDICFDYRVCGPSGEPSITWVEQGGPDSPIAPNFVTFLEGLYDEDADTLTRVDGDYSARQVAELLAAYLSTEVHDSGSAGQGYPVFRLAMPGQYEWLFISPNRVPTGFERRGRRVHTTDQTALRIPEAPECSVLIGATQASEPALARAIKALGL